MSYGTVQALPVEDGRYHAYVKVGIVEIECSHRHKTEATAERCAETYLYPLWASPNNTTPATNGGSQ